MLGRLVQSRSPLFSRLSAWDVDVGGASGLCSTVAGDVYDVVIVGAGMVGAGLASGLGGWILEQQYTLRCPVGLIITSDGADLSAPDITRWCGYYGYYL